jgi:hypothetical protein
MARLNVTDRRLLVDEIIKRLSIDPKKEKQKLFEKYLKDTKQKKKYDELVKQAEVIKELNEKYAAECRSLIFPDGYNFWKVDSLYNFENNVKSTFIVNNTPSVAEIETKILLSGSDDLAALIESIVNEYKQQQ